LKVTLDVDKETPDAYQNMK